MLVYLQMIESEEDKSKFEQIYLRYRGLMFYVSNKILHNEHDAEDAVHQAFLSIILNLNKISDVECPKTRGYIVTIVESKAIDIIRARARISPVEFDETIGGIEIPLPGDGDLADSLAKLPARYRDILLLRFYSGYTTKELAEMFGMTHGSMQKLVWRAKEALQKQLDKGGCDDI